ncbi:hypothetical protein HJFPF1_09308 [Paramyrothecium foliicola]|nr:hypothetical protein HJFPF1_09308 [Paramyrothecium foliicola]
MPSENPFAQLAEPANSQVDTDSAIDVRTRSGDSFPLLADPYPTTHDYVEPQQPAAFMFGISEWTQAPSNDTAQESDISISVSGAYGEYALQRNMHSRDPWNHLMLRNAMPLPVHYPTMQTTLSREGSLYTLAGGIPPHRWEAWRWACRTSLVVTLLCEVPMGKSNTVDGTRLYQVLFQRDVEDGRAADPRDSVDKDDFPLAAPASANNLAAVRRMQHGMHKALGVLFIGSIILGVAVVLTVLWRLFLEFFAYDDKDKGWGSNGYEARDIPVALLSLGSIMFAVLNRTRLRVHQKPLPPLVNVSVLAGMLATIAIVGFGMVPWPNEGDESCADRLADIDPTLPHHSFYLKYCNRTVLYSRVRKLDMVLVDAHASLNLLLLILSLGLFYCSKRIAGEGLLTSGIEAVKQVGNDASDKEW